MIYLFNSKLGKKEEFIPIDPKNVRMYVCGPTVYDRPHLGNGRPVVIFDMLFRLLRHVYGEDNVTYVRNFTDIDDKIIDKSNGTGISVDIVTNSAIDMFHHDMDSIGALRPTFEPKATEHVDNIIDMIIELIGNGHAYFHENGIWFDVKSFDRYGEFTNRNLSNALSGVRVSVKDKKVNEDFVLWKLSKDNEPSWDSPWGKGRPGWHIECSAMAKHYFGQHFDIHGGGIDLKFPHHENEIAQSCCAHKTDKFVNYWVHNELLMVDGEKMAKSKNNFFTIKDLVDQGYSPNVIRMVYLKTHYSKTMNWTEQKATESKKLLSKYKKKIEGVKSDGSNNDEIIYHLSQDLNTHMALNVLHNFYNSKEEKSASYLKFGLEFMGFDMNLEI